MRECDVCQNLVSRAPTKGRGLKFMMGLENGKRGILS